MRFPSNEITYDVSDDCNLDKKSQVAEAFNIIENRTVLDFSHTQNNPQIQIVCSDLAPEPEFEDHFVAGEGGPTEIINTSLYAVILSGKISLFRDEKCDRPLIALHELFHVLGFDHNNNPNSILFPTLGCEHQIDDYLIDSINELYSVKSAPDLIIDKINGSKSGRYLGFEINVINQGLIPVDSAELMVYANGKFVKSFDLGDVDIGTRKVLTVENIKIPRSSEKISFVVRDKSGAKEIFENNNRAELVLDDQ